MSRNALYSRVMFARRGVGRLLVATVVAGLALPLAGASSSAASTKKASGTVNVLYAGSFHDLMELHLGPAFHKATGYTVSGISAGSSALASEISGKTVVGDVFISASPTVNASLEGASNGNWVSSYREFGFSPLVLGYYAKSKFAKDLQTRSWYDVVDLPGFLLGRTDPATDPKGVLAVDALEGTALTHDIPALNALATSKSNVFEETALVGQLQAGQLDAGFFYGVEAAAAHLKTVPLKGTALSGQYTVAILNRAPHRAAAKAFVAFLLSKAGRSILNKYGVKPIMSPVVTKASSTRSTTSTTSVTARTSP
ncbi:MAG TPA: extracellular solute-binding protein [Acidimicrobiales bacterium]|nr:extracellular solute-binding protein [Acidimicrobiales bacterium]